MARNREREKFVTSIKTGDTVRFCGVLYEVVGIPNVPGFTAEEAALAGIKNLTSVYVKPVDPTAPLRLLRKDLQSADGEDW